jgi:zinc D-Ala-D-Ala carboxypeptidase
MTRVPAGAGALVGTAGYDEAFDDRFPTQPIAVARSQVGLVLDDRHRRVSPVYREPPPSWHHHAASAGGVSHRAPARTAARPARSTILVAVAVVVAAIVGAVGYQSWATSSSSATREPRAVSVPATSPATADRPADDAPGSDVRPGDRRGAAGEADGVVPDGVTVFDDEFPAVAKLDASLLKALRRAAKDAARNGITFSVNSGWRSAAYQDQLLREAVSEYGSEKAAARWVATADTSPHVSGDAVDIGPTAAAAWLSKNGAEYGLCQIYRNEPWHYELRPDAVDDGCPRMYADPTHDPRMQK